MLVLWLSCCCMSKTCISISLFSSKKELLKHLKTKSFSTRTDFCKLVSEKVHWGKFVNCYLFVWNLCWHICIWFSMKINNLEQSCRQFQICLHLLTLLGKFTVTSDNSLKYFWENSHPGGTLILLDSLKDFSLVDILF